MSQAKIKQIQGLQSTLDSIAGIDTITETFSTSISTGDTGIILTYSSRETDNTKIYINGHLTGSDSYSWKKDGSLVTATSLESGTELVWNSLNAGFELDETDKIQIIYETLSSGNNLEGNTGIRGTVIGNLIPDQNEAYDLGSPDKKFRDLYLSGNTLYMGGQPLSIVNGQLTLNGAPVTGSTDTLYSSGQTTGTNYPIFESYELHDLYSIPSGYIYGYSENEEIIVTGGSTIKFYQLDLVNNTSSIIASSPTATICPDFKSNFTIFLSYNGLSGIISYRTISNDSERVFFNINGGQVNVLPDPFPNSGSDTGRLVNTFLNRGDSSTSVAKLAKWNGASYDYETIYDMQLLVPGAPNGGLNRYLSASGDVCVCFISITGNSPLEMFIIRYDGLNWNVEFTATNVNPAVTRNGITPNGDTVLYVDLNFNEIVTLKYQSGVWNTVNILQSPTYTQIDNLETSISVNGDRMTHAGYLWEWDGSQWNKITQKLSHSLYFFQKFFEFPSGSWYQTANKIFSSIDNSVLVPHMIRQGIIDIYTEPYRIQLPINWNNFSTNVLFAGQDLETASDSTYVFWSGFIQGTPNTHTNPNSIEYSFNDTLAYKPGDNVLIHTDNFEIMWKMKVVNNDTSNNVLTLLPIYRSTNNTQPPHIYTTYHIKPFN